MSAQNSAGIQTLLDAEREAQKIVQRENVLHPLPTSSLPSSKPKPKTHLTSTSSLPKDRTKKVKDARSEAQKEIDDYRQQKDDEFKKFEKEHTSGNQKAESDAKQDAENQIRAIKEASGKAGDEVVEELLRVVMDVKPEVPDRVQVPA